jgi:hypothetical protein
MKTADFSGKPKAKGQIGAPPDVAALAPPGEQIQVVLQGGVSEDDAAWRAAARRPFEAAYANDEPIYESFKPIE